MFVFLSCFPGWFDPVTAKSEKGGRKSPGSGSLPDPDVPDAAEFEKIWPAWQERNSARESSE